MYLKSLSASAVKSWEDCPARAVASSVNKIPQGPAEAADLGSACHMALEFFVKAVHMETDPAKKLPDTVELLLQLFDTAFKSYFGNTKTRYAEGVEMMKKWHARTDFSDRKVLSTEVKTSFMLPTSQGPLQFNYIFDRVDRIESTGEIDVVDYKSWMWARDVDAMEEDPQMRAYALAGAIQFKNLNPKHVWVTLDQLRHETVSTRFSRDQNKQTWTFLQEVAEEMIATDPENAPEKLNPICGFCVRRHACKTLQSHASVQGVFSIDDPVEATKRLADIQAHRKALERLESDLQSFLLEYSAQNGDLAAWDADDYVGSISISRRRKVDPGRIADVIGAEMFAEIGNITLGSIDELLKSDRLTSDQKRQINSYITMGYGNPTVKAKSKGRLGA